MSDFIKLTMIDFNTHADAIEREILIRPYDIISVHGDACVADSKCTEVITNMMDCKNTYYVKESIDEILRKIDPLEYIDSDDFKFFNTPSCNACKYKEYDINTEPCFSCSRGHDKWKPKEEKDG